MVIYLIGAAVAGLALIAVAVAKGWGFYAYLGGAVLVFSGIGGLAGMKQQGGFGMVTCPSCGNQGRVQFTRVHRTLQCAACQTWLHGAESMSVVPDDHVDDRPVFWAAMAKDAALGTDCLQCGAPSTRRVPVEATKGAATAVALGAGIVTTFTLQAPACAAHDAPVGLMPDSTSDSKTAIGFRSLAQWRRFRAANSAAAVPASAQLPRA